MYHYTRSGLDNVWLTNGFRREDLGEYGVTMVVDDVDALERAIARQLAELPRPLSGQEFRFLRSMLDMTQSQVGRCLGKDYQTVARWEAAERKPVPRFADTAMRQRYLESLGERPLFSETEDRLASFPASFAGDVPRLVFERQSNSVWRRSDAPVVQAA